MERLFLLLLRLASVAALVFLTSFPRAALAFEQKRTVSHQPLEFFREAAFPKIPSQTEGSFTVTATAYSSVIGETDSDPFTTASGSRTRIGTAAANFLPLGTQLRIGGRIYVVEDRLNSRFEGERWIDIWMTMPEMARQFGVRSLEIEIVQRPE